MTPTVKTDAYELYLGDCEAILPHMAPVDLLLTDPPYGIGYAGSMKLGQEKHHWKQYEGGWDEERPSADAFKLLLESARHQIIWGGSYFADYLPPSMGWLCWDKTQRGMSMADGELAWTSFQNAMRIFSANRVVFVQEGGRDHPTQKPVCLMNWAIQYADRHGAAKIILDCYMGTGTTGVAALRLGRKFIGIERDPDYFEIARQRLEAATGTFAPREFGGLFAETTP